MPLSRTACERLLESLADAVIVADLEGRIVHANPAAHRLFGGSPGELVGVSLVELMPAETRGRFMVGFARYRARRTPVLLGRSLHARALRRDGVEVDVELTLSTFEAEGRELVAASLRIADEAALAVENARLYREAQEASRARDAFLLLAAHELNTPLTPLRLQVEGLLRSATKAGAADLPPRMITRIRSVDEHVGRVAKVAGYLLDVAQIITRRLELVVEEVDLADVARDVAARLRGELSHASCPLELHLEHVVGKWDRRRVEQILEGLLSNAMKYGAGGAITIDVHSEDGGAKLVVQDHGIGIPPEGRARIFERFERLASPNQYGGLGLGLWVVRQIVEAHRGSITVESEEGSGSTFTVTLPARSAFERAA